MGTEQEKQDVAEDEGCVANTGVLPLLDISADPADEESAPAVSGEPATNLDGNQVSSIEVPFPAGAAHWRASRSHIHFVPVGQDSLIPACRRKKGDAGRSLFHRTESGAGEASTWDFALSLGLAICSKCAEALRAGERRTR